MVAPSSNLRILAVCVALASPLLGCTLLVPGADEYVGGLNCGGDACGGMSGAGRGGGTGQGLGGSQGGSTASEPKAGTSGASACTATSPTGPKGTWVLEFCDDFDDQLDSAKWGIGYGWGVMSNSVAGDVSAAQIGVSGGLLELAASTTAGARRSSAVNTRATYEFTYGYVETRIRVARGNGLETMVMCYAADLGERPWLVPVNVLGSDPGAEWDAGPDRADFSYAPLQGGWTAKTVTAQGAAFSEDFHVFGVQRTPSAVTYYLDGSPVLESPPDGSVTPTAAYLRLEVQNCPSTFWSSCPASLGDDYRPAAVDYVRAWKQD